MSQPALLDVNLLIALFDPEHIHHDTAHRWFGESKRGPWASCPLTENGLVRVVSSPAYPGRRTTVADATERLRIFCERSDHLFWPDSVTVRDREQFDAVSIPGSTQVMDVYLLALAVANGGVLATFDQSISLAAVRGASENQLVVLSAA